METDGGGWTMVVRAKTQSGSIQPNFNKDSSTAQTAAVTGIMSNSFASMEPWMCYWKYLSNNNKGVERKETATKEYYERVGRKDGDSWGCDVSTDTYSQQITSWHSNSAPLTEDNNGDTMSEVLFVTQKDTRSVEGQSSLRVRTGRYMDARIGSSGASSKSDILNVLGSTPTSDSSRCASNCVLCSLGALFGQPTGLWFGQPLCLAAGGDLHTRSRCDC